MPKALAIASVMSAEPHGIAVSPTQHAAGVDRDVGHLARRTRPARRRARAPRAVRQAWPAAIGEATTASTSRCAFCTASVRLRIGAPSASMTWMSTPSRSAWRPARIGDAVRAVERCSAPAGRAAPCARRAGCTSRAGDQQVLDVVLLDPPAADVDLDLGDAAGEPGARAADPHAGDAGAGDLLGPLDRVAHRISRRGHVGDVAALDPLRGAVARCRARSSRRVSDRPGDHRRDAERADVDRAEHAGDARRLVACGWLAISGCLPLAASSAWPLRAAARARACRCGRARACRTRRPCRRAGG